jgi:hypothetical protein
MSTNVHALRNERVFDLSDPSTMVLDLDNPKLKDVLALDAAFVAEIGRHPPEPLGLSNGWQDITPELAVRMLMHNVPGANRWIDPATVVYFARQMARGDWKATGQPILFNVHDILLDAQHRLYAGLISGATFRSYVITDVADEPGMFMYIDNGKVRSPASALQTAGFNGVSPIIARMLRFGEEVRLGVFNPSSGLSKLPRLSPAEVVRLAHQNENAQAAARSATSDWLDATTYLERKDIVAYVGMRIIDVHGENVAEDFFEDVTAQTDQPADHPITALRKEIDKASRMVKRMPRQNLAALLILAFNAWHTSATLGRRWQWGHTEDFPSIVEPTEQLEAAE